VESIQIQKMSSLFLSLVFKMVRSFTGSCFFIQHSIRDVIVVNIGRGHAVSGPEVTTVQRLGRVGLSISPWPFHTGHSCMTFFITRLPCIPCRGHGFALGAPSALFDGLYCSDVVMSLCRFKSEKCFAIVNHFSFLSSYYHQVFYRKLGFLSQHFSLDVVVVIF